MLIISLILSMLLLLIANGFARYGPRPSAMAAYSTLGVLAVFPLFPLMAVVLQAFLLCAVAWFWRIRRPPASFLRLSCAATLVAYIPSTLMALRVEREDASLRARNPYESMSPPATAERLSRPEAVPTRGFNRYRAHQLETLHEQAVGLFIQSPGVGISRLDPGWSPGEFRRPSAHDDAPLVDRLLDGSILDFANPRDLGHSKDRDHGAGSSGHRFSEVPAPTDRWRVGNIELVGLLLHDEPAAYVSPELPRMDRVREVPTRPLDRFEKLALHSLRQGEDVVASEEGGGIRMLGAVRAINQCTACHDCDRGALLGAFSYTLRPAEPQSRPGDR